MALEDYWVWKSFTNSLSKLEDPALPGLGRSEAVLSLEEGGGDMTMKIGIGTLKNERRKRMRAF